MKAILTFAGCLFASFVAAMSTMAIWGKAFGYGEEKEEQE